MKKTLTAPLLFTLRSPHDRNWRSFFDRYHHFSFRFADDRIIPRFHLEGVEAGRRVSVFKIDPGTNKRLGLLTTASVGEGGWVDLGEPIIMRAGEAFIAVPGQERVQEEERRHG